MAFSEGGFISQFTLKHNECTLYLLLYIHMLTRDLATYRSSLKTTPNSVSSWLLFQMPELNWKLAFFSHNAHIAQRFNSSAHLTCHTLAGQQCFQLQRKHISQCFRSFPMKSHKCFLQSCWFTVALTNFLGYPNHTTLQIHCHDRVSVEPTWLEIKSAKSAQTRIQKITGFQLLPVGSEYWL